MAGLRRPSTTGSATTDHPEELESPELDSTEVLPEPATESAYTPPVWHDPEPEIVPAEQELVGTEPDTVDEFPSADVPAEDTAVEDEAPRAPRPTGKRRAHGLTRPANLAEAEVGTLDAEEQLPPTNPTLVRAVVLGLAVLALTALAIWFRGEASSRTENADTNNQALTDTARTSEVTGQVRDALEKDLSYNYTDMDSTAKAVKDTIAGRASCEYDQLFGEVKKLAPEQKLVLTTRVREIGVTRLEGNQAVLLVFVDQTTTRADQNQTTASGAQFNVHAERQGDRWKITQFDMLNQQLANGKPAPNC